MCWRSIKFALQQYRYKPSPRFDKYPHVRDQYYLFVATAVKDQLKLAWAFARKTDGKKVE